MTAAMSALAGATEIWRLLIVHRTVLSYPDTVVTSYNEVRMQPSDEQGQAVLSSRLELDPFEGVFGYQDYFGTRVASFDVHRPHRHLAITATTTVETFAGVVERRSSEMSWAELEAADCHDRFEEFLTPTPLTDVLDEPAGIAAQIRAETDTPAAAGRAVCDWVHSTLAYTPGATGVSTSAMEAYYARRGVCQDLTHLAIGMLRSIGVPARYVSGYLHPDRHAEIGRAVSGESHAWVEWWDGAWTRFDPTNATAPELAHVVVGRGRDYRDVPPVKGVYAGPDATGNDVSVRVTRLR